MKRRLLKPLVLPLASLVLLGAAPRAEAQAYPSKPIREGRIKPD
jgi:hypothetical protein